MSSQNIESERSAQDSQRNWKKSGTDSKIKDKQKESMLRQSKLKFSNEKTSRLSRKILGLRKSDKEQQQWDETQKPRHKASNQKQDTPLECYVKMIEYLKKIEWDQANQQNKMNPFHAMTATCFWFSICAQYYSYNFFGRRRGNQVAHQYLNRVLKMPVPLCSRINKIVKPNALLQFETQEFRETALPVSEKLNLLIPAQLNNIKNDTVDKGSGITSVAEDDLFRSSTRTWVYNYIKAKIDSSDKWKAALSAALKPVSELAPRTVTKKVIQFAPDPKSQNEQQKQALSIRQIRKKTRGRKPRNWNKLNDQMRMDQQQQGNLSGQPKVTPVKSIQPRSEQLLQNDDSDDNSHNQKPQDYPFLKQQLRKPDTHKNGNCQNSEGQDSDSDDSLDQCKQDQNKAVNQIDYKMEVQIQNSHSKQSVEKQLQDNQKGNQDDHDGDDSEEERKGNLFFTEKRHYSDNDLIMEAVLHLPLEKVISVMQSLLPKNNCPEVIEPFMKYPTVDPLDFVFQLHPEQEYYLEYMKQNRPSLLERKRKRIQNQKMRKIEEERIKKEQMEQQNKEKDYFEVQKMEVEKDIQKEVKQQKSQSDEQKQKQDNTVNKLGQNQKMQIQDQPQQKLQDRKLQEHHQHYSQKDHHLTVHSLKRSIQTQVNSTLEDQQQDPKQFQDAKCQICTDGDYTDDNLIVFCSTCNISLHQRCVGLAKVPSDNWVCQLCTAFGPAGCNVPCPLCCVRGGALKRTGIHIDAGFWKENNPEYHEFTKKCAFSKQKQQYSPLQGDIKQEMVYYDYFKRSSYTSVIRPECHYVWCHYVCAIWVPECYFEEKNGQINIKGIQNIEKKRYKLECFICRKERAGACVKCDDPGCQKYYHPQCARKKKVYMQQLNLQKLKYLIFCADHEPLKITRQIQYKKKKQRDQIIKFCRMIEKYVETYKIAHLPFKLHKNILTSASLSNRMKEQQSIQNSNFKANGNAVQTTLSDNQKKRTLKNDDQQFIKNVVNQLQKNMMFVIHLEKVPSSNPLKKVSSLSQNCNVELSKNRAYKVASIQEPSARTMKKCLSRYNQFWNAFGDQQGQKSFARYDRIMNSNKRLRDSMENFLTAGSYGVSQAQQQKNLLQPPKKSNAGRKKKNNTQTLLDEVGSIYCICKKPYQGETDMIQCEVCSQWYHFDCIGFNGGERGAEQIQFHCMKCLKNEDQERAIEILQKARSFFNPGAVYLSYRPPTPMLHSDQQIPEAPLHAKQDERQNNSKQKQGLLGTLIANFQDQINQIEQSQRLKKNSPQELK